MGMALYPTSAIAEGSDNMGAGGGPNATLLAEAENTPRLASETIFRYARECYPREEPDALTRTSGSVRGAQGNLHKR